MYSHYTGAGVPISSATLLQDEQDVLWSRLNDVYEARHPSALLSGEPNVS